MIKIPKVLFDKYGAEKIASIHLKNGVKEVIVYDQITGQEDKLCLVTKKFK